MTKYELTTMAECNLKSLVSLSREMLGIFSGHYQALVFNPDADVYYVGIMVEKLRDIISEASEELKKREERIIPSPIPESSVSSKLKGMDWKELLKAFSEI